ncbi:MAG TPA: rhamnose isomerase, partial [Lacisediminihabitans sp.]
HAQNTGDVLTANTILMDAFYTDVRPDLAHWRTTHGLPENPTTAYTTSPYPHTITTQRTTGQQTGWGA